jgi:hypothetical protein
LTAAIKGETELESKSYYSESLVGLLEGSDPKERRTLISGDAKLILTQIRDTEVSVELFDLATDPGENSDLSKDSAARLDRLERELRAWRG